MNPRYTCHVCGKKFDRGAFIEGNRVWCMDCRMAFEDIVNDYLAEYIHAKIFGGKIPNLDEFLNSRKNEIERKKLTTKRVKHEILFRLWALERGGAIRTP